MNNLIKFPFPVFITQEDKWFVAACQVLGIATQGATEQEVKENMQDLIQEYLTDPDTPKDRIRELASSSLSYISVPIAREFLYG